MSTQICRYSSFTGMREMEPDAAIHLMVGASVGALVVPALTRLGLRQLRWTTRLPRSALLVASTTGAGAVALLSAAGSQGGDYLSLTAVVSWSCALIALAMCDALTNRIPTPLVRQSTVAVAGTLCVVGAASGEWTPVARAVAGAVAAAAALHTAAQHAGAGRGDVRLAGLGGLGLGHATAGGLMLGLGVWGSVVAGQAVAVRAHGGSLKEEIALGPGLVACFLTACMVSG